MPLKIERADDAQAGFPMWKKDYPARGTISLVKDAETDQPMLKFQPAHNTGEPAPKPQLYRIVF